MLEGLFSLSGLVGFLLAILLGGCFSFWLLPVIKRPKHSIFFPLLLAFLVGIFSLAMLPVAIKLAHILHLSMGHFGYPFLDTYLLGTLIIMIGTLIAAWVFPSKHYAKIKQP